MQACARTRLINALRSGVGGKPATIFVLGITVVKCDLRLRLVGTFQVTHTAAAWYCATGPGTRRGDTNGAAIGTKRMYQRNMKAPQHERGNEGACKDMKAQEGPRAIHHDIMQASKHNTDENTSGRTIAGDKNLFVVRQVRLLGIWVAR